VFAVAVTEGFALEVGDASAVDERVEVEVGVTREAEVGDGVGDAVGVVGDAVGVAGDGVGVDTTGGVGVAVA
jgi:hypothetical protein